MFTHGRPIHYVDCCCYQQPGCCAGECVHWERKMRGSTATTKKRSISLSHSGLNTAHVTRSWSAAHSRRRVITDRMEHWQQLSIYDRLCGALPMCTVTTVVVWYVAAMGYAINKAKNFQTIIYVLTEKKASKSAYGLLAFEVSFRITNDRAVKRNGAKAVWISNDAKI